jgi:hypothetical protein
LGIDPGLQNISNTVRPVSLLDKSVRPIAEVMT